MSTIPSSSSPNLPRSIKRSSNNSFKSKRSSSVNKDVKDAKEINDIKDTNEIQVETSVNQSFSHPSSTKSQKKLVQVITRVKPTSSDNRCIQVTSPQTLTLFASPHTGEERKYRFPYVFPESTSQSLVYQSLSPTLMESAWNGCNCSIFSYGEQESGKTYTLYGYLGGRKDSFETTKINESFENEDLENEARPRESISSEDTFNSIAADSKKNNRDHEAGIVPRFLRDIFSEIQQRKQIRRARDIVDDEDFNQHERYKIIISMVEIRNEKVFDLLNPSNPENDKATGLKIREHPKFGPYAPSLSLFDVRDDKEVLRIVRKALKQSSKGHTILQVILTQTKFDWKKKEAATDVVSRINLVDLGAPERLDTASDYHKKKVQEGTSINLTLATLGLVITKLSEQSVESSHSANSPSKSILHNQSFVPYRDSSLTWLLRESLGGNSISIVLACINPQEKHSVHTWSTLRFASRASRVTNRIKVNMYTNDNILQELQREIELLQKKLKSFNGPDIEKNEEYIRMKEDLEDAKFLTTTIKMAPEERKITFENIRKEMEEKRKSTQASSVSTYDVVRLMNFPTRELPYLYHLNPKSQSDKVLYFLSNSIVTLGSDKDCSIILEGANISPKHAVFQVSTNTVTISPTPHSKVYINGNLIHGTTILHGYDRIFISELGFKYFPRELLTNKNTEFSLMDWEASKNEYMKHRMEEIEKKLQEALPLENKLEKVSHELEEKQFMNNELEKQLQILENQRIEKMKYIQSIEARNSGIWTWCCWIWCCPLMCCSRRKKYEINPENSKNFDPLMDKEIHESTTIQILNSKNHTKKSKIELVEDLADDKEEPIQSIESIEPIEPIDPEEEEISISEVESGFTAYTPIKKK